MVGRHVANRLMLVGQVVGGLQYLRSGYRCSEAEVNCELVGTTQLSGGWEVKTVGEHSRLAWGR